MGTTNFQALIAGGYKDIFAKAANVVDTKRDVSTLLIAKIQAQGTITGALDNRMSAATPRRRAGDADHRHRRRSPDLAALLALALSLIAGGGLLRRRPARG